MHIDLKGAGLPITLSVPALRGSGLSVRDGQVLQATVAKVEGERMLLEIGGRLLDARSELPLQAGQSLQLRATVSARQVRFQVLPPPQQPDPLVQATRTALPRQIDLGALFPLLSEAAEQDPQLPEALRTASRQLLDHLATPQRLSQPAEFKRAVLDSGIFLEHRLASGERALGGDLKANLLRLATALRATLEAAAPRVAEQSVAPSSTATARPPSVPPNATPLSRPQAPDSGGHAATRTQPEHPVSRPGGGATTRPQPEGPARLDRRPEIPSATAPQRTEGSAPAAPLRDSGDWLVQLLRHAEGAIARLQLHQTATLQRQDAEEPLWLMELPIRDATGKHVVQLRIRDEGRRQDKAQTQRWSVTLELPLPHHGRVQAVVSLTDGAVSTSFWAEQDDTAQLFRQRLDLLRSRLQEAGLSVHQLASYTGRLQLDDPIGESFDGLLDVHA